MEKFFLFFFTSFLTFQISNFALPTSDILDIDQGPVHILEDAQRFLNNPNHIEQFMQLPEWTLKMAIRLLHTNKTGQRLDELNVEPILQRLNNLTNDPHYGTTLNLSKLKTDFPEIKDHLYEIFALAECFTQQHITNLIITDNDLTEEFISQNICHLKHLIHIDISNNKLTDLPYFIFNLPHLETITVNDNNIKALSQRAQLN